MKRQAISIKITYLLWRRWRDSNSRRAFDPYTISNRARSTNYATSPRVCSRKSYQLVSLPIIMQPSGKVKQYFCAPRRCASVPLFTGKMPCFLRIVFPPVADNNDYMRAKSEEAFRRAAKLRSKTAWLFCHRFMAMSIGRMMEKSFAAKPVVWQRNQSKPRLISPSDDHDKSAWKKAQRRNGI